MSDPATVTRGPAPADLLTVATGPGSVLLLRALVEAARWRHLGRETDVRAGDVAVRMVPTALDAPFGVRALATGRLDEVRLHARDVAGPAVRLRELTVVATGVRLRPALVPELVTGPVRVIAVLDPGWVAARIREHAPGLDVTVDADGVPRARSRTRPGLGSAEVALDVDGHRLTWRVAALTVAGRRIGWGSGWGSGWGAGTVDLPGLPAGLRLTGLDTAPDAVTVHGRLPSWSRPLPTAGPEEILRGALALLALR